ncbi:MAG: MOSC domain-containing protein [Chloroflexota bacterium]
MKNSLKGIVEGLFLGLQAESLVTTPVSEVQVTFEGFAGDKHAGWTRLSDSRTPYYERGTLIRNDRQVSLVSSEELAEIAAAMGIATVQAEWLGANLLLSGIPQLTRLPPPSRLHFAKGVVLTVSSENLPCSGPAKIIQQHYADRQGLAQQFIRAASGKRGLVAVVEHPGIISLGETVSIETPKQYSYRL